MKRLTLYSGTLLLGLALRSTAASDLQTGDFIGWDVVQVGNGGATVEVESSGGHPGERLLVQTRTGAGSSAWGGVIRQGVPPRPLVGVDFQLSFDVLSGAGAGGDGQAIRIVVEENESLYGNYLGVTGYPRNWDQLTFKGSFAPGDFTRISGSGPSNPTLDSITAIGFMGGNSYSNTVNQYYDNLRITTGLDEWSSEVPLLAKSTYLQPADPLDVVSEVQDAFTVDLSQDLAFAVEPGDYIRLQAIGEFDFADMADDQGPFGDGTIGDVWGVFSSDGQLGDVDLETTPLTHRVLSSVPIVEGDAAEVGMDVGGTIPDQPHDFIIPSELGGDFSGVVVRVPEMATHLLLGAADEVWFDNTDADNDYGVRITRVYEGRMFGDYNFDGLVNAADYTVWRDSLGETGVDPRADGDLDGDVDVDDYLVWRSSYGTIVGAGSNLTVETVPEPAAVILCGCLAGFLLGCRRQS